MEELCEVKREDVRKLRTNIIKKIKATCKEKADSLKAQNFTEPMSTKQRQRGRSGLGKFQINKQFKREVRESLVCSPKDKAKGKDELF